MRKVFNFFYSAPFDEYLYVTRGMWVCVLKHVLFTLYKKDMYGIAVRKLYNQVCPGVLTL